MKQKNNFYSFLVKKKYFIDLNNLINVQIFSIKQMKCSACTVNTCKNENKIFCKGIVEEIKCTCKCHIDGLESFFATAVALTGGSYLTNSENSALIIL